MKKKIKIKDVLGVEFSPWTSLVEAFGIEQPRKNQVLTEDGLTITGWVIGKVSPVEKILLSGGINEEIPVDIHRADLLTRFANIEENAYPLIDSLLRSGFSKQVALDALNIGKPIEISVLLQNGKKIPLTVIVFIEENIISEKNAFPNMLFYYFGHNEEGYFLNSCRELLKVFPLSGCSDLNARPLPNEKEESINCYDVFVPIPYGGVFIQSNPSVIKQLPDYVIEDLKIQKCSLIFDHSNEAVTWGLCSFIRNELLDRGVNNFNNVMVLAQNRILGESFVDIPVFLFDYWIIKPAISLYKQLVAEEWDNRLHNSWKYGKVKNILCMNNLRKLHRWLTVVLLIKKGMFDNSLISFLGSDNNSPSESSYQDVLNFAANNEGLQNLNSSINWLEHNTPLKIKEATKIRDEMVYGADFSFFEQTLLSVVTESETYNSIQRITEKSLKAFALGHPSVIIGSPNSIKLIEEMGFDVFREFIDHSYDQMDDWVQRMDSAIDQGVAFCESWRNYTIDIDKVQAISKKNRDWLRSGFFENYYNLYVFPILSSLASKY